MAEGIDYAKIAEEKRNRMLEPLDPITIVQQVWEIWRRWANFSITIITPEVPHFNPPRIIPPELISGTDQLEFVYTIQDYGYKLNTSKAEEMFTAGMSMCKLYYTIEKIINIIIDRLKSTGVDTETEIQVSFEGHELAQRKAFESVINLNYNMVVVNFDPAAWGENYLEVVKLLAKLGYGYPPEAPRDIYKQLHDAGHVRAKKT